MIARTRIISDYNVYQSFYVVQACIKSSPSNYHLMISIYVTLQRYLSAQYNNSTISSSHNRLNHNYSSSNKIWNSYIIRFPHIWNSYIVRFPHLWNSLPPIDFNELVSFIKAYIYNYLWKHFKANFNQFNPCSFHYLAMYLLKLLPEESYNKPCHEQGRFRLTCMNQLYSYVYS